MHSAAKLCVREYACCGAPLRASGPSDGVAAALSRCGTTFGLVELTPRRGRPYVSARFEVGSLNSAITLSCRCIWAQQASSAAPFTIPAAAFSGVRKMAGRCDSMQDDCYGIFTPGTIHCVASTSFSCLSSKHHAFSWLQKRALVDMHSPGFEPGSCISPRPTTGPSVLFF